MRLIENSCTLKLFESLSAANSATDPKFKETVLRDFKNFIEDKYDIKNFNELNRKLKNLSEKDIDDYFTGMFYEIADTGDTESAGLAREIIIDEFGVLDTYSDDYEYDDGDTNWAAEEEADALERMERRYGSMDESEDSERILAKLVKDLPDTVEYKGKTYQAFNVMSNDITGATSKVYYCNMENTPSGDPQESNDYFFVVATLKKTDRGYKGVDHINYVEDLTEGVSNRKHITERASNKHKVKESVEEHDLSKDLFGDEAANRMSQKEKKLKRDLQYVRDIMAGKKVIDDKYHEEISLNTAKHWLRDDFIYVNELSSYDSDEVNKRLADAYPDIFSVNESVKSKKSAKKQPKENKRVIMQQGNVTCFKENDNTYYVFENENDNEVEHDSEESAMHDFLERVGIDANAELKEK